MLISWCLLNISWVTSARDWNTDRDLWDFLCSFKRPEKQRGEAREASGGCMQGHVGSHDDTKGEPAWRKEEEEERHSGQRERMWRERGELHNRGEGLICFWLRVLKLWEADCLWGWASLDHQSQSSSWMSPTGRKPSSYQLLQGSVSSQLDQSHLWAALFTSLI